MGYHIVCVVLLVFSVVIWLDTTNARRNRIPIPKSLIVADANGIDVILDAVELMKKTNIFSDDHHLIKRIAIVEASYNRTANDGGLWQVEKCAFLGVTQNRRKYKKLAALQKQVRRRLGITWSKVRHFDLRRPLYSIVAARLYLEIILDTFPRKLRNQARLWGTRYHQCLESGKNVRSPPLLPYQRNEEVFINGE